MKLENQIIHGDCLEAMKDIPDKSIDMICTDPPYGYNFMGKSWDKTIVSVDIWKECLRVLKHGSFCFVMSSPRQDVLSRMIVRLEDAGFNMGFTSLYHAYASGFPKAIDMEKTLKKKYNHGNMHAYGKDKKISELSMQDVWKTIIYQTESNGKSNDGSCLQEMLADLESGKQCKITFESITGKKTQISERQKKSFMERRSHISKTERELWTCQICKMPVGIFINGKKGRICYVSSISNGATYWEAIDSNGMRTSYKSRFNGQFNSEFNPICKQCSTQEIRKIAGAKGGFQPKPAVEIILVCMKPLSEKTFVDQVMKNGKGVTWLDDCRIPFESENDKKQTSFRPCGGNPQPMDWHKDIKQKEWNNNNQGRFPANLLVSDDILNDGNITISDGGKKPIDKREVYSKYNKNIDYYSYNDSGSFSRYFDLDAWTKEAQKVYPFMLIPKASKSEKNEGCNELEEKEHHILESRPCDYKENSKRAEFVMRKPTKNIHPTVKPVTLMYYLITLASRVGDIILDPFAGSGTMGIAAINSRRKYILIEREKEYYDIIVKRIEEAQEGMALFRSAE